MRFAQSNALVRLKGSRTGIRSMRRNMLHGRAHKTQSKKSASLERYKAYCFGFNKLRFKLAYQRMTDLKTLKACSSHKVKLRRHGLRMLCNNALSKRLQRILTIKSNYHVRSKAYHSAFPQIRHYTSQRTLSRMKYARSSLLVSMKLWKTGIELLKWNAYYSKVAFITVNWTKRRQVLRIYIEIYKYLHTISFSVSSP